jgi:hypothetical protein
MKDAALDDDSRRAVLAATLVIGLLVTQQAAGRATRDALFLSTFPVAFLPMVMMAASAASIAAVGVVSWALARRSPFRILPVAAGLSAVMLLVEWGLCLAVPRVAAVAVYLHLALFGGTLLSGFWSLVNERFDPYTAKRVVGTIGVGSSVGGIAGGLLAWGASRVIPVPAMLLVMAALTVGAMGAMARIGHGHAPPASTPAAPASAPSALGILRRVPYLRDLALVVAIGAVTDNLLDYVLKSQAAGTFSRGAEFMSFFAVINTVFGILGLAVQATLSRTSLRTLGLAGTVALRPVTVFVISLLGFLDPRMWVSILARAGHDINTGSLFRSGYELLFTPLPEAEKRPTKAVVDVGFDKLGSLLGGAVALLAVALVPTQTVRVLFALAAVLCLAAFAFTGRLHRGYVRALEQSLRAGRVRLDVSEVQDEATLLTIAHSGLHLDRETLLRELRGGAEPAEGFPEAADPILEAIADLRSGEKDRVRRALRFSPEPPAALVPHLIPLLARDDLFLEVLRALRRVAPVVTGQLLDALLDPREDPAVRRRLPRVLKACTSRRAVEGLLSALEDAPFDVRAECGRSLAAMTGREPSLIVPRDVVFGSALRELTRLPPAEAGGLEHVFTMLSLTLEREPLQLTFRALRGSDRVLRGTALEYLENILPEGLWRALAPLLGERAHAPRPARSREVVVQELITSSAALPVSREALRARLRLGKSKP